MRVFPEKLLQHLEKSPAPLYWVAGDEPLLVQEACDAIRAAALRQGFSERKVFHADKKDHWQEALAEANALSLFADRSFLDIRTAVGKLDHAAVLEYLARPNPDCLVLVCSDKVDNPTQKTQWFKAMEQACAFVPVQPLDSSRFPAWLGERARRQQLTLAPEALKLLVEHTEGNLLAAVQELHKLALQFGNAPVTAEQVEASVGDSAHYDVFALNDALLAGDAAQALKILTTLQLEGNNALAVAGALTRELRQLAMAAEDLDRGMAPQAALRQVGVWEKRQPLFSRALQRMNARRAREMIRLLAAVDQSVKGMLRRDPWDVLQDLCLLVTRAA